MFESELDNSEQLAQKSAVSLYIQINPHNKEVQSMAKTEFNKELPIWAKKYLHAVPERIWNGPIKKTTRILSNK